MNHFTTVNVKRNSGEKELKRAKQAGQRRASGSDCNLAVNRMLTMRQDLPAWIDKLWLRRRTMTNNAMNCPDGVSAFSNRDQMKRYDPTASVDASRNFWKSSSWWSALNISVHDQVAHPEKTSNDEQQRPRRYDTPREVVRRWTTTFRSAADLRKSSTTRRSKISTQPNSTSSENVLAVNLRAEIPRLPVDFKTGALAEFPRSSCWSQRCKAHASQVRKQACSKSDHIQHTGWLHNTNKKDNNKYHTISCISYISNIQ